jgi:hypothetical protein
MQNIGIKEGDYNLEAMRKFVYTPKPSTPKDVVSMLTKNSSYYHEQ